MTTEQRKAMETVCDFLKKANTFYIASIDGDQARVRPFGVIHIFEDKLYIQTGRVKDCYKQFKKNPKVEISAMYHGRWIRLAGELVEDDRIEAEKSLLDAYKEMFSDGSYKAGDGNNCVMYFKNAHATINSFTQPQEVYDF